jgi:drug/metabolite transporter (DMT)-like permease
VALATMGLALLSLTADLHIQPGDLLVFGCTIAYAAHILLLGHHAPRHDPFTLTLGQVMTVALCSGVAALLFDQPTGFNGQVIFAAAFTGVLATAAAFGVQTIAQRFTTTTHTALIFAAEPVFAGLFSLLLIGELLGPRQLLGCALILGGMLVAELRRK